ncbi:MAG: serine hydrolase [Chitinophagaceae bacterium]
MSKKPFFILAAACCWLVHDLYAQKKSSVFDQYMQAQADIYGFNGNVLVAQNGKVLYKKSFGYADYNTKITLDSNSVFDCGSIAKEIYSNGYSFVEG